MQQSETSEPLGPFEPAPGAGFIYAGLTALALTPLLIWPIPRTADLINHWARLTLINMPLSDPLRAYYQYKLAIIPNLAIDLAAVCLLPILSAQSIVTLFWMLAIIVPAWGVWRLQLALFGRPQLTLLLAPLAAYNIVVSTGLVNFAVGMGLTLHAMAWWLTIDRQRIWARFFLFNAIGVALFFCHIAAYAAFCLIICLIEATPAPGDTPRQWLRRCLVAALATCGAFALWPLAEPIDSRVAYASPKILAFFAPVWSGIPVSDMIALGGVLGILAFAYLGRQLRASRQLVWPMLFFGMIALAIPSSWGSGSLLDARLMALWFLIGIATLGWEWRGANARIAPWIVGTLCVARVATVMPEWQAYDRDASALRQALGAIEPGQRALVVQSSEALCSIDMTYEQHLADFAIIDRRAMVNTLFTGAGMQPVRPVRRFDQSLSWEPQHWASLDQSEAGSPTALASKWRDNFDIVIALHGPCSWRPQGEGLRLIGQSPLADIYSLK